MPKIFYKVEMHKSNFLTEKINSNTKKYFAKQIKNSFNNFIYFQIIDNNQEIALLELKFNQLQLINKHIDFDYIYETYLEHYLCYDCITLITIFTYNDIMLQINTAREYLNILEKIIPNFKKPNITNKVNFVNNLNKDQLLRSNIPFYMDQLQSSYYNLSYNILENNNFFNIYNEFNNFNFQGDIYKYMCNLPSYKKQLYYFTSENIQEIFDLIFEDFYINDIVPYQPQIQNNINIIRQTLKNKKYQKLIDFFENEIITPQLIMNTLIK